MPAQDVVRRTGFWCLEVTAQMFLRQEYRQVYLVNPSKLMALLILENAMTHEVSYQFLEFVTREHSNIHAYKNAIKNEKCEEKRDI